jgi:hypothetical protein
VHEVEICDVNHDSLTWVDPHDGDCRDAAHLLWRLPGGRKRRSAGGGGILDADRAAELREMEQLRIEHRVLTDKVAQLEVVVFRLLSFPSRDFLWGSWRFDAL